MSELAKRSSKRLGRAARRRAAAQQQRQQPRGRLRQSQSQPAALPRHPLCMGASASVSVKVALCTLSGWGARGVPPGSMTSSALISGLSAAAPATKAGMNTPGAHGAGCQSRAASGGGGVRTAAGSTSGNHSGGQGRHRPCQWPFQALPYAWEQARPFL